jgi:U3 small nucleolar ribonucleoprotein protein LCP5
MPSSSIDSDALAEILSHIESTTSDLNDRLAPLLQEIKDLPTNDGVTLIQIKLHSLLSYLQNLAYFVLIKINGLEIDQELISNLIEHRLVMEKIKPLEIKIKYQIEKLIKSAVLQSDVPMVEEEEEEVDPLLFKPNPKSLQPQESVSIEESNVYKPPRVASMPYIEKNVKFDKNKALRSRILTDLKDQYDDRPEEFSAGGTGYGNKDTNATKEDVTWNEREAFEEENFMRLNMTREDKRLVKRLSRTGGLMRFHNEFQNLEKDFRGVSDLNKFTKVKDGQDFGTGGILRKRNQKLHDLKSSGLHNISGVSKRKGLDLSEAVKSFATSRKSALGQDAFKRDVKRLKKNKK